MADYTFEMFSIDQKEILPVMEEYYSLDTLDRKKDSTGTRSAVEQILAYFVNKYGKRKGWDYEVRFLTTTSFIDRYQIDLIRLGLISEADSSSLRVQEGLLTFLLDSFKPPQANDIMPTSPLLNQNHEFNYKKVIKALKSGE